MSTHEERALKRHKTNIGSPIGCVQHPAVLRAHPEPPAVHVSGQDNSSTAAPIGGTNAELPSDTAREEGHPSGAERASNPVQQLQTLQLLQIRSMVIEYIQRSLIDSGFFPSSGLNDQCVQHVLGHNNLREAQKNMGKFTAVTKMEIANDASKGYRSKTGQGVKAEFVRVHALSCLTDASKPHQS
ncbi:TPA: hypothetical protein ACH3X1_009862 [Trebouxia sp. C0004]